MTASRNRSAARRPSGARKSAAASRATKPARKVVAKVPVAPPEPMLYRFCKSGWAVLVERSPSQQGTCGSSARSVPSRIAYLVRCGGFVRCAARNG